MKVVTFIYHDFLGTDEMQSSCKRYHELDVLRVPDHPPTHAERVYDWYMSTSEDYFCYADAADTYFQRVVNVPKNYLLWSTEKACFPFPQLADRHPKTESRWKYLNNGVYCGPVALIREHYQRYKLYDVHHRNGQAANMEAFLQASAEGFPIKLDQGCEELQSIAFLEMDDFRVEDNVIKNNILGTSPAILHGNGTSEMKWIYEYGRRRTQNN